MHFQTVAREQAERALADAQARHTLKVMAESARLDECEQEAAAAKAEADAVMAAAVRRFVDDVAAVARRMDSLVAARERQRLADEIADADRSLAALEADSLEAVHPPSEIKDKEELEARGINEAEEAIAQGDDLLDGGSPSLPARAPEILRPPVAAPGGLPASVAMGDAADLREFGRTFVSGRDQRTARKALRSARR
jgi:hypothetical protein